MPPGKSQRIRVEPPMEPSDRPLVFGNADAFQIETVDASTVVLTNRTPAWASFVLLIVPRFVASAAVFPWRAFLDRLKLPGGPAQAGMAIVHQLQQRFLDPGYPHDPESRANDPESRTDDPDLKPE